MSSICAVALVREPAGTGSPAAAAKEPGAGGGTRELLCIRRICCSVRRPARMRGPSQSLRKATASPAAASHAWCPLRSSDLHISDTQAVSIRWMGELCMILSK